MWILRKTLDINLLLDYVNAQEINVFMHRIPDNLWHKVYLLPMPGFPNEADFSSGKKNNCSVLHIGFFVCFEHILLISSKGLGTSSNNLLVPLLEVIQYVMRNKLYIN